MLTVGSLFAGIGGFDLGLERAGMRVLWQCEIDPYCQRVLAKHWPDVPCYPDVRALVADASGQRHESHLRSVPTDGQAVERRLAANGRSGAEGRGVPVSVPYVDVLAGGFPCQDLSYAGKGAGIDGERSGLWAEFARLIRGLRPRYVIVENVPALLSRGLGRVLGDLAACGYDAEWDCIPASAVGAPHRRDRIWLVAYPNGEGQPGESVDARSRRGELVQGNESAGTPAYPRGIGCNGHAGQCRTGGPATEWSQTRDHAEFSNPPSGESRDYWLIEPDVGRVADGVPARVHRLRSLGNAIVPQIAEWIGRRIIEWELGAAADAPPSTAARQS